MKVRERSWSRCLVLNIQFSVHQVFWFGMQLGVVVKTFFDEPRNSLIILKFSLHNAVHDRRSFLRWGSMLIRCPTFSAINDSVFHAIIPTFCNKDTKVLRFGGIMRRILHPQIFRSSQGNCIRGIVLAWFSISPHFLLNLNNSKLYTTRKFGSDKTAPQLTLQDNQRKS